MELTKKAKQELVDMISRSAQILEFDGEDMAVTMRDVKRLNLKLAGGAISEATLWITSDHVTKLLNEMREEYP